ncbi:uncharacterized protein LOC125373463 [Haliotis rufescens]|uniref:uncharacterized protein LOC125373463 n=1 Tax=Haliotis rufescens TaxID=6454 RepID=UPI00201F0405|nr:uncharacterized protein LOC125373463 [Haliotis rufescens]
MRVQSKYIIFCVAMSIVLQMATAGNDIRKSEDNKLIRKKRFISALTAISGAVSALYPVVKDIFGLGRPDTESAAAKMREMMESDEAKKMTERLHGRAEMLLVVLEERLKMYKSAASSTCICPFSWLMFPAVILVVVKLLGDVV